MCRRQRQPIDRREQPMPDLPERMCERFVELRLIEGDPSKEAPERAGAGWTRGVRVAMPNGLFAASAVTVPSSHIPATMVETMAMV